MKQYKITLLTSIGAGLEYYDYVIYVIFASFISHNFFPSTSRTAGLFAVFLVFAIGNIIRPLGGIILGIFGDLWGRKKIFAVTILWMAIATFLMGITPTFATWGIVATIVFSLCRIFQGITCGAEIPGATTFLLEHTHTKKHGLHFGFMTSAIGLGSSFGLFVAWVLTKILSNEQMFAWGFRVPFLLGGALALVGFLIRKYVPETPEFLAIKKSSNKDFIRDIFANLKQIANIIGILLFPACFITLFLALPVYLHDFYQYPFADIYLVMTVGSIWTSLLMPVFGWVSDRLMGRKALLIMAVLLFVFLVFPAFSLLQLKTRLALFVFILFGKTIIAAMAASYFVLLPQAFPTRVRYTCTSFSYNVAYTVAALAPLFMNYAYGVANNPSYLVLMLIALAIITMFSVVILKIKNETPKLVRRDILSIPLPD